MATPPSSRRAREARSKAIDVLPELENYRWQDTYFDHDSRYDVIAVLDHDASALRCRQLIFSIFGTSLIASFVLLISPLALMEINSIVLFCAVDCRSSIPCALSPDLELLHTSHCGDLRRSGPPKGQRMWTRL
jgi:hypothetical protein